MTRTATLQDLKLERFLRERNSDDIVWRTDNGDNLSIRRISDKNLEQAIESLEINSNGNRE